MLTEEQHLEQKPSAIAWLLLGTLMGAACMLMFVAPPHRPHGYYDNEFQFSLVRQIERKSDGKTFYTFYIYGDQVMVPESDLIHLLK